MATLSSVQSPSNESNHPYHDTIRILSAACERLVRQAASLERARKSLQQKEARRKRAAERAVKELKPGQRDTGQQLLNAIYGLEPAEAINHTALHSTKTPNVSFVCCFIYTVLNPHRPYLNPSRKPCKKSGRPPAREPTSLQPTQPLDIPPPSDALSVRSRASSFTPGSSIASHSIRSDKTSASKTFLGGWFGRPMSRADGTEDDEPDPDVDVISFVSANPSIAGSGNATAKMVNGVLRKGRSVFNAFGIAPTSSSVPTPSLIETPQKHLDELPDSDSPSHLR